MKDVVEQALGLWGMTGARYRLIAARENQVFRIDHGNTAFALRIHRTGYRTDEELWSELRWMERVAQGRVNVPNPKASIAGKFLETIQGKQVDMLTWLPGEPMGSATGGLIPGDPVRLFRDLGRGMAELHAASDDWDRPHGFVRPAWDRNGLVGEMPLWDRFWDNPSLSKRERELFLELRDVARTEIARQEDELDYGLIHADLVRENVLVDGDQLLFIDFDDGGYGYRLFDIATALRPNLGEANYPELKEALFEGYRELRPIDVALLDLMMAIRMATYVGWIISRMGEDGANARNERFINNARAFAEAYLS